MIIDLSDDSSIIIYQLPKYFIIQYSHVSLPCQLSYISHGQYYQIEYHSDDHVEVHDKPFLVLFVNYFTSLDDGHSCYIENIHKTDEYSGSEIITVIMKFLNLCDITCINLIDRAKLVGDTQLLSERLLVRSGYSYYQRFGFNYVVFPSFFTRLRYNSSSELLQDKIRRTVKKIQKNDDTMSKYRIQLRRLLSDSLMEFRVP